MNRIRPIREGAGISQAMLYRALGWKQSRLANYEAGKRTPGLSEAREIVSALNSLSTCCSLEDVFPDEAVKPGSDARGLPTLEQKITVQTPHQQVGVSPVHPSSTTQATP